MAAAPVVEICSPIELMGELCHVLDSDGKHNFERVPTGRANAEAETQRRARSAPPISSKASTAALRLLQSFGATSGPMTLSDLARAADLPRATARRILFTLAHGGFVSTDGKLFSLTPHVLTLAGSYLQVEPGGGGAAAGARPRRDLGAGNQFARGARRRRRRVHRARQPGAGVFRRPRYRLSPAGLLHLGRPRHARPVRRCRSGETAEGDAPRTADAAHRDRSEAPARRHRRATGSRAIRWSTARPSRISVRSRCRCAATTTPSSPPSTWARMSIACRRRN